jgi:hypothetical protein
VKRVEIESWRFWTFHVDGLLTSLINMQQFLPNVF